MDAEARPWNAAPAALPVGEDIEAVLDDLLEERWAPPAAVEDHRDAPHADEPTHLCEQDRQHGDEPGVGLGGDDEERVAVLVVGPVVGGGRHGDAHAGQMSLRQRVFPVIGADVAVHVEEAQRGAARCDPLLGKRPAELGGAPQGGEPGELAPQGLHLGCAVETEEAAEVAGRVLLERLGPLEAKERHEQHGDDGGAQPVEGRADGAVDLPGDVEDAAVGEGREREQHAGARDSGAGPEQRRRVVQQAQVCKQSVTATVGRIRVHRDLRRASTTGRRHESGQVWVRTLRCPADGCRALRLWLSSLRRGWRSRKSGQVWVRRPGPAECQASLLQRALRRPAHAPHQLAHRLLRHADLRGDGAIGEPLGLEATHQASSRRTKSTPPSRVSAAAPEGREAVLGEALLMTSHRP